MYYAEICLFFNIAIYNMYAVDKLKHNLTLSRHLMYESFNILLSVCVILYQFFNLIMINHAIHITVY